MSAIALILPAYNEAQTISQTIKEFAKELPDAYFVVIDNNSTDSTYDIALSAISDLKLNGIILKEKRQGKGNAVRRAFLEIDADIYVLADADLTYPANRVMDLINPIENGDADMVVGDRLSGGHYANENKRNFHGFGNQLVIWLVNNFFNAKMCDIMSGYRVFNKNFVLGYPTLYEGFELETDLTLHALDKRLRILEIPIEYKDRPVGSKSKLNTIRDGAKVIFAIAQIVRYYRPLLFFSLISIAFLITGLIASIPPVFDWIQFRYVYHVPLAVLAASLEIVAVLTLGIGIILDSIAHQEKMLFERESRKLARLKKPN